MHADTSLGSCFTACLEGRVEFVWQRNARARNPIVMMPSRKMMMNSTGRCRFRAWTANRTMETPPTIRASPISAGTSSVCRNQNHPTKAIKTMPSPAHMA